MAGREADDSNAGQSNMQEPGSQLINKENKQAGHESQINQLSSSQDKRQGASHLSQYDTQLDQHNYSQADQQSYSQAEQFSSQDENKYYHTNQHGSNYDRNEYYEEGFGRKKGGLHHTKDGKLSSPLVGTIKRGSIGGTGERGETSSVTPRVVENDPFMGKIGGGNIPLVGQIKRGSISGIGERGFAFSYVGDEKNPFNTKLGAEIKYGSMGMHDSKIKGKTKKKEKLTAGISGSKFSKSNNEYYQSMGGLKPSTKPVSLGAGRGQSILGSVNRSQTVGHLSRQMGNTAGKGSITGSNNAARSSFGGNNGGMRNRAGSNFRNNRTTRNVRITGGGSAMQQRNERRSSTEKKKSRSDKR